jgi:hypothetical protein
METPRKPTWFSRNWKWLVPSGCLSGLVVAGAFVAIVLSIVFASMRSSDAYRQAVDRAKGSPAVTEALGTPIEEGLFVSGNVSVNGPTGSASLSIPLSGPRGEGKLFVEAKKSAGEWTFSVLVFEAGATKERTSLLGEGADR